jgi:hypothetical protein
MQHAMMVDGWMMMMMMIQLETDGDCSDKIKVTMMYDTFL